MVNGTNLFISLLKGYNELLGYRVYADLYKCAFNEKWDDKYRDTIIHC